MLQINSLAAGYEDFQVIKDLSLDFKPNKVNLIIGTNGAGKSTVLKSIFNQTTITNGTIQLNNTNLTKLPTSDLIQEGIGYIPQGRQLFPDMTVHENIELGGYLFKDKELLRRNLEKVYKQFPKLQQRKKQLAKTLSGGEQQLVAMARTLVQDPKIILLDEPSAGLSPIAMKEIFAIIKELAQEKTIILVEQNIKQAMVISDYVYILKNGNLIFEGKPSEKLIRMII